MNRLNFQLPVEGVGCIHNLCFIQFDSRFHYSSFHSLQQKGRELFFVCWISILNISDEFETIISSGAFHKLIDLLKKLIEKSEARLSMKISR